MIIIAETNDGKSEVVRSKFCEALNEEDTIFLLFRSDKQNESQIQDIAVKADNYAQKWEPTTYRVMMIKKQDILKDAVDKYFGDDKKIVAVSLRLGKGEREISKRYELSEINDTIKIGEAFSNAG